MSYVLAIDPGTKESAMLSFDGKLVRAFCHPRVYENGELLAMLRATIPRVPLLIESVEGYGQRVGAEVFATVEWSGRFREAWERSGGTVHKVPRRTVKAHLCGVQKAKDADIRQALLYKFGDGTRATAVGVKAKPGPLYGISSHLWAALAIAVTYLDQHGGVK